MEIKRAHKIILGLILFSGILLRLPQINFPSIGYHNMKENEYVSIARNMEKTGNLIRRDVDFYHGLETGRTQETFDAYPQVPIVSYQIILGDRLFGENLWFGRLVNILFFMLAVIAAFLIATQLTANLACGLITAALLSIMPLGVFFSRNLQQEPAAFLFMTLAILFLLRFSDDFSQKNAMRAGLGLALTTALKMSFLIGLLPVALIFPWRKYWDEVSRKDKIRHAAFFCLPMFLLIVFWAIAGQLGLRASLEGRVNFLDVISPDYWKRYGPAIWRYAIAENYGPIFLFTFLAGTVLALVNFKKDRSRLAVYLRANILALVVYFMLFSDYLNQHNYYQMPFLLFFVLSILYILQRLGIYLERFQLKQLHATIVSFALVLLASIPGIKTALYNVYSTIFYGQDVAGEYLRYWTKPSERFFIYTWAQGYATCIYADRKCGWPKTLEEFQKAQSRWDIKYLVIYPYAMINNLPKELGDYITANYGLELVGGMLQNDIFMPQIAILKRGQPYDPAAIFSGQRMPHLAKIYSTINGQVPFYLVELDNK